MVLATGRQYAANRAPWGTAALRMTSFVGALTRASEERFPKALPSVLKDL